MRLLLISDIHNAKPQIEWIYKCVEFYKPNQIICLGDCVTGSPTSFIVEMFNQLLAFTSNIFFIPGNHDPLDIQDQIKTLPITSLHNNRVEFAGINFVGKGGSLPCPVKTLYEESDEIIAQSIDKTVQPGDILCLHNPVWGYRDMLPDYNSGFHKHIGSRSLLKLVEDVQPSIVFSGHVHAAIGFDHIGPTWYINPGAVIDGHAALFEFTSGRMQCMHFLKYPEI